MATLVTADEFLAAPEPDGVRLELVRGEVRTSPFHGGAAGAVADNVRAALSTFIRERSLGWCFGRVGFWLPLPPEPPHRSRAVRTVDTVRGPDVAFVRRGRVPSGKFDAGWIRLAPDIAVVVLSPGETASETLEKLVDYFAAGTRLVWVVAPAKRLLAAYAADAPTRWLHEGGVLDGGVVPGFALPVDALFEDVAVT